MRAMAMDHAPRAVASAFPYDKWHDRYQEYYQTGLRQYLQLYGSDLQVARRTHFPTKSSARRNFFAGTFATASKRRMQCSTPSSPVGPPHTRTMKQRSKTGT